MRSDSQITVERIDFDNGWSFTYQDKGKDVRAFVEIMDDDSPITVARKMTQFAKAIHGIAWPEGVPIG